MWNLDSKECEQSLIARNFEAISNPAEPNINISKPQLSDETIPQDSLKFDEWVKK